MKFKDRARGKSELPPQESDRQPCGPTETFIDRGCELVGQLHFAEDVRIEGNVEGQIHAAKTVIVGEAAEIQASIEAATLEIYGTVEGDVKVTRGTTLYKSARVKGEIQTAGIVVEEGAKFKGCIVIGAEESPIEQARPTAAAAKMPGDSQPAETKKTGS